MPEISRFYGIVIAMFYGEHNPPHFHARYGKDKVAWRSEAFGSWKEGFRRGRWASSWSGRPSTKTNCSLAGKKPETRDRRQG
jgi:hypothetical protein